MPREAEYCDGVRSMSDIRVSYSLERQGLMELIPLDVMGVFRFCELCGRAGIEVELPSVLREPIGHTGANPKSCELASSSPSARLDCHVMQ
jgi:hypothetical protein